MSYAKGIDVSHWEGVIDWVTASKDPHTEFVFMKCTEGIEYPDLKFPGNWQGVRANGRFRSPYHFIGKDHPGSDQSNFFWENVSRQNDKTLDLPPVIDLEDEYKVPHSWYIEHRTAFWGIMDELVDQITVQFQEVPLVYSNAGFCDDMRPPAFLAELPLWVANTGVYAPYLPLPWRTAGKTWLFWQYSFSGRIPGIPNAVDLDYFRGNSAQLAEYVRTRTIPGEFIPTLPAGVRIKTRLNIRKSPRKITTNWHGNIYPANGHYPQATVYELAPDVDGAARLWGRITGELWICLREGASWYVEWV